MKYSHIKSFLPTELDFTLCKYAPSFTTIRNRATDFIRTRMSNEERQNGSYGRNGKSNNPKLGQKAKAVPLAS